MLNRIPRSPISLLRWLINARPALRSQPGGPGCKVAGIMATRNYANAASSFETLQALCDVTLVLDDNSDSLFPHRDECTEYLALGGNHPWSAPGNLTLLMYRAFIHGCEWVISLDDDLIPCSGFQTRADVDVLLRRMQDKRLDICRFKLWDLWDSGDRIRVDGVWSRKTFPVCHRNWFFYPGVTLRDPALRLHTPAFPVSHRMRYEVHPQHAIYHTGCMTPALRQARVDKYRREDPANRFQKDYEYMLNEEGLEMRPVPGADAAVVGQKCRVASA